MSSNPYSASRAGSWNIYGAGPSPPEIVQAMSQTIAALNAIPDKNPEKIWNALSLVLLNVVASIDWSDNIQRERAIVELFERLFRDLAQFETPTAGVSGSA